MHANANENKSVPSLPVCAALPMDCPRTVCVLVTDTLVSKMTLPVLRSSCFRFVCLCGSLAGGSLAQHLDLFGSCTLRETDMSRSHLWTDGEESVSSPRARPQNLIFVSAVDGFRSSVLPVEVKPSQTGHPRMQHFVWIPF